MPRTNRLTKYRRKRDFAASPEPRGSPAAGRGSSRFVVHLHHASHRHFDLRLQVGDSLRSWAVPKGPSLDPRNKRLAVQVEDHPLEYGDFEGEIPEGHYGAGEVRIWDRGTWAPRGDPAQSLTQGHLSFTLQGERLRGAWSLIRTRRPARQPQWLLIKSRDAAARSGHEADDVPLSRRSKGARRAPRRVSARTHAGSRGRAAARAPRARRVRTNGAFPDHIELQLARLVEAAPEGNAWLHEVKFDGYRVLIWRNGVDTRVTSRGAQDWTRKLPAAVRAAGRLSCRSCILDGELVSLDARGNSSFGLLQQRLGSATGATELRIMVFDLLFLDGDDLRELPQIERKRKLARLLARADPSLELTPYTVGDGPAAARSACGQGLEGIVSKLADGRYEAGRGGAWVKCKCVQSDEYAIVGYTAGRGARARLGSLLLGTPARGPAWRYRGRVGTGMDQAMIGELLRELRKSAQPPRFIQAPTRAQLRGANPIWVRPALVAEVEFRGETADGLLRQPSLKGLRRDRDVGSLRPRARDAADIPAPAAAQSAPQDPPPPSGATARPKVAGVVRLTHPDRVLFRRPRVTKHDLADFYRRIADFVIPGLINRPLMLLRCPDGASGACFFQKHAGRGFPSAVHELHDRVDRQRWLYIKDLEGLMALVQMNCLEYHTWGATIDDLERADRLVIDLDPGAGVRWKAVIDAALMLRARLADLGVQSFVRTSGGKGLHVVIPLHPPAAWDSVHDFARALAEEIAQDQPQRFLAVAARARRRGRVFLDYLRNARGSTAVCSYSLRNRPGAPLATPLTWDELPRVRAPDEFRFDNIARRLAHLDADPWAGIERLTQSLPRRERRA